MALIKCKGCGHMVSDKGTKCPKCGTLINETESKLATTSQESKIEVNNIQEESISSVGENVEESHRSKKGIVAIICGIIFMALAVGGYFLWKNNSGGLVELFSDDHPAYSAELVENAEKGDPIAQCDLGLCYHHGEGVEQDCAEAARWFRKSAEQGYVDGQYNLGLCYYYGEGVDRDYDEAERWFQKAADQGHEQAIEVLKDF